MILRTAITLMATLSSGVAVAADCPADFEFVAPQGHSQRATSISGLKALFKAGAAKDEAAFMATAADPYIQHSPDLADGMKPVWDLLSNRPDGF